MIDLSLLNSLAFPLKGETRNCCCGNLESLPILVLLRNELIVRKENNLGAVK